MHKQKITSATIDDHDYDHVHNYIVILIRSLLVPIRKFINYLALAIVGLPTTFYI